MINIKIVIGSTRLGRYSIKPANWIFGELRQLDNVNAELLDLRDFPLPFFDDPIPPSQQIGQHNNPTVRKWSEKIKEADAFIIVSPEYNHGYPGVLKNAIDYLYHEWNRKPVGFVSYGTVAGARVVEQLRLVAIELQLIPIQNAIHIPMEIYNNTINEELLHCPQIFNKVLRKENKDIAGDFINELIDLTQAIR